MTALRGERVIIKTREGNLILTAERDAARPILGSLKNRIHTTPGTDLAQPTTGDHEWMISDSGLLTVIW